LEALGLSRHCRQKCDIRAISDERLHSNSLKYWQVVGVQVEQNWCKDRALRKAVTLGFPRTGVIAHVHCAP